MIEAACRLAYYETVHELFSGGGTPGVEGGGVAIWAHVGGFAACAALIFLFRDPELLARHPYYGWRAVANTPLASRRPVNASFRY